MLEHLFYYDIARCYAERFVLQVLYTTANKEGRLWHVYEPYFDGSSTTYAATYSYDMYGRPDNVTTPAGITSYAYNGLTATVTSPSETRETTLNASGQTAIVKVNGKSVSYEYYPSGLVKNTTPQDGQAIITEYDLQGNRTRLIDPDAGEIRSEYNGFGGLLWTEQQIHLAPVALTRTDYDYNNNGLLNQITRSGATTETTSYAYDSKNRVSSITIAGQHRQTFTYDNFDRITNLKEEITGTKVYDRQATYDSYGRIQRETFPSGYYTENTYDANGILTEVNDRYGNLIWKFVEENARGQLVKETKGGKTTTYGYDSYGFLSSINCPDVINMSFSFGSDGNLNNRKDLIAGWEERFTYNNNRLASWDIYQGNLLKQSNTVSYHSTTGNIQSKSGVGSDMAYGELNGKPHALTSFLPDPSALPAPVLNTTYTDFNKIETLSEEDKFYELTYGVDRQRRKSVYKENNIVKQTRYYLGNYEEEENSTGNSRKIHYLRDGGVFIQNSDGTNELLYTYTDHLGSLTVLTNQAGTVIERYAYDPWGARRNPTDWTQRDLRTSWKLNRGFTGHEHIDQFGIINMNGRVYDPLTAQFFSPDPFIQAPDNWFNYNRYAYCYNNPLIYTDPSGEFINIFFRALVFVAELFYAPSIKDAWKKSGDVVNEVSSVAQIPIYKNDNILITAGLDPLSIGVSANVHYTPNEGKTTLYGSVGYGYFGGFNVSGGISQKIGDWDIGGNIGAGKNYWGWNTSVTYKGYGLGYGQTHYGGEHAQTTGTANIFFPGGSFRIENDFLLPKKYGQHDRWRTSAWELTVGDWSIGSNVYTNDPKTEGRGFDLDGRDGMGNLNKDFGGEKFGAWKNGQVYSSPLWIGFQGSRAGYSHRMVQDRTQNWVHRNGFFYLPFGHQNFYNKYDNFYTGFAGYSGHYSPFSLYW